MAYAVSRTGLDVGQWVQFKTDGDLSEVPEEEQAIYQENQRYLVFSRNNFADDPCRCYLIDMNCKRWDYCPRVLFLDHFSLAWDVKITGFSRESVEVIHGSEQVEVVYEAARKCIEELKDYFAQDPARILGVEPEADGST